MSSYKSIPALLLLVLLGACSTQSASPPTTLPAPRDSILTFQDGPITYHINTRHIATVGETYDIRISSELNIKITVNDPDSKKPPHVEDQLQTTEFDARVQITEVAADGSRTAAALTVNHCTAAEGKELIPPGSKVKVERRPNGVAFMLANGKLNDDAIKALNLLNLLDSSDSLTPSDEARGPGDPAAIHKVGESWPLHLPAEIKSPIASGLRGEVTDMHGQMSLKSLEKINDIPALRIATTFDGKLKMHDLPFGFTADPCDMEFTTQDAFPLDASTPPLQSDQHVRFHIVLSGSILFIPIKSDMLMTMHQKQTITPLPKDSPRSTQPAALLPPTPPKGAVHPA